MLDMKNALEIINEVVVIPAAIITFSLLMYIVYYLWNKDPDVIRSRIFLKYGEFKKAFLLFALFAFVLILHVSLIYIPHLFSLEDSPLIEDLQRFFGLALTLILITFVSYIYRSMR
ncbi:MAG: hypothetical protein OIN66_07630 [Candidatus Methanoperedens sp.]|nr:hypothetical protein [Candidatus Methanoperedens sp.]